MSRLEVVEYRGEKRERHPAEVETVHPNPRPVGAASAEEASAGGEVDLLSLHAPRQLLRLEALVLTDGVIERAVVDDCGEADRPHLFFLPEELIGPHFGERVAWVLLIELPLLRLQEFLALEKVVDRP